MRPDLQNSAAIKPVYVVLTISYLTLPRYVYGVEEYHKKYFPCLNTFLKSMMAFSATCKISQPVQLIYLFALPWFALKKPWWELNLIHSFVISSSSIAMKSFVKCQTFLWYSTTLCYYSATLDIVSKLFRTSCFSYLSLSLLLKMYKCSFERLLMCETFGQDPSRSVFEFHF